MKQFSKLAVAFQAADCHHVPVEEPTLDELLVFVPRQCLYEEEVLGWDAILQARWLDDDLEVCVRLLHVQASDEFFRELLQRRGLF